MKSISIMTIVFIFLLQSFGFSQGIYQGSFPNYSSWKNNPAVDIFYSQLATYGRWTFHNTYGWVWQPYNVYPDWRPYTLGHWAFTDYGWLWVSDEPWGWACYHYGRWFYDSGYGWLWYPGEEWGPAWVIWRYGAGWIGWAPLPPQIVWRPDLGLEFNYLQIEELIPPYAFSFVETRFFVSVTVIKHIVIHTKNDEIVKKTRAIVDYKQEDNKIVNDLPVEAREEVERSSGENIKERKVIEVDNLALQQADKEKVRIFKPKNDEFKKEEKIFDRQDRRERIERIEAPRRPERIEQIDRSGPRRLEAPRIIQTPPARIQTPPQGTRRIERIEQIDRSGPSRLEAPHIQAVPPETRRIERIERFERIEQKGGEDIFNQKQGQEQERLKEERVEFKEERRGSDKGKGKDRQEIERALEENRHRGRRGLKAIEPPITPLPQMK